ncbi:ADP-forming succinate--CoA ligase subunit beta [bacterium]|nr:ADP-forming succinate--CoA ligase subunit beta [bacterium]
MKIHEYQARRLFEEAGIPVARAETAKTPAEAEAAAARIGTAVAVKAQVHVGGRGKAGGVKLAGGPKEAAAAAEKILGMTIKGSVVRQVLVMEKVNIAREVYLGLVFDRDRRGHGLIVSAAGGVDIEEVAAKTPEKIHREFIHPLAGLSGFQARKAAFSLGIPKPAALETAKTLMALYGLFQKTDATLAEINPYVIRPDGTTVAIDAKMNFDDNALFRHRAIESLRDMQEEEPLEIEAKSADLAYVHLGGDIGIIGNGAGLVMTTLDVVTACGGKPANFLDIGGSSSPEKVRRALEIVLKEKGLKVIFLNVFGGITRCDDVATGLVQAIRSLAPKIPIVIRMTGTNVELGMNILKESGLNLKTHPTMQAAAAEAARLSGT